MASILTHFALCVLATWRIASKKDTQFTWGTKFIFFFKFLFLHNNSAPGSLVLALPWDDSSMFAKANSSPSALCDPWESTTLFLEPSPPIMTVSLSRLHWKDQIRVHKNKNQMKTWKFLTNEQYSITQEGFHPNKETRRSTTVNNKTIYRHPTC